MVAQALGLDPVLQSGWYAQASASLILLILAELLYNALQSKSPDARVLSAAGLAGVLPAFQLAEFQKTLAFGSPLVLVNTWVANLEPIKTDLREAILTKQMPVEISVLAPGSEAASIREKELLHRNAGSVDSAIGQNLEDIRHFVLSLPESARPLVSVFTYTLTPKFTIYGNRRRAVVGLYLYRDYAVDTPQFVIEGEVGWLAERVWYYHKLLEDNRTDVTAALLAGDMGPS